MPNWKTLQTSGVEAQGHGRILGLVCLIAFAMPFLFGYGTAPLTNFAGEIVSAAGFAMLLIAAVQYGDIAAHGLRLKVFWTVLALLACATVAQYALFGSRNLAAWLMVACYLAIAAAAAWIGHAAHASERAELWVRATAGAMVVGSILAACASIAQYFGLDGTLIVLSPSVDSGRTFGFIRQPNHQGTFLNLGVAGLFALSRLIRRPMGIWLLSLGSPILAFGIISTGSRTALIQLVFLSFCAVAAMRRAPRGIWIALLPLAWAGCIWLLLFALSQQGDLAFYGTHKLAQTASEGLGMRAEMWRQTLILASDRPWLGAGLVYYTATFFLSGAAEKVGLVMSHSHNIFTQIIYAYGVPIALIFFSAVSWLLWSARYHFGRLGGNFAFGILGCIGIHSMLEFPLWYMYFLLPACFSLGWLCYGNEVDELRNLRSDKNAIERSAISLRKKIAISLGVVTMAMVVWINKDYYRLTPVYTSGLASTLEERLNLAYKVFWFHQYADFLKLHRQPMDASNANQYLNVASALGCTIYEAWYQPKMIVALAYAGRIDDIKWILYSFSRLSGGKVEQYKAAIIASQPPNAAEILSYLDEPKPPQKSTSLLTTQCYGARGEVAPQPSGAR